MKRLITFGLIAGVLSIISCRQSEKIYIYPPSPMDNAKDFVGKYGPEIQTFPTNTSELPKTFTLKNGTKVTVPHFALQQNGDYVTGELLFEGCEAFKRSDVMLGGLNTNNYDGLPLNSRAILWTNILHYGKYVDQDIVNVMKISIPAIQDGFVKISSGNVNSDGSELLAWGPKTIDSINSVENAYTFQTMRIGWFNCGVYFARGLAYGNLTVNLENNPGAIATNRGDKGNTFVYFCPKSSNVALQLRSYGFNNVVACTRDMMPVRIDGKLIAFSIKDRKFYYAEKEITTTANAIQSLTFAEVSIDDLLTNIRNTDTY